MALVEAHDALKGARTALPAAAPPAALAPREELGEPRWPREQRVRRKDDADRRLRGGVREGLRGGSEVVRVEGGARAGIGAEAATEESGVTSLCSCGMPGVAEHTARKSRTASACKSADADTQTARW